MVLLRALSPLSPGRCTSHVPRRLAAFGASQVAAAQMTQRKTRTRAPHQPAKAPVAAKTASLPFSVPQSNHYFCSYSTMSSNNDDFYALSFKTLDGKDYPFEQLRDKVVLIVNVASKCGFTPQYKGLEELHKKYADKGLVILGFPSNQFGGQEPGGAEEIQGFCQKNYGVSFQIMEKSDVNGGNENPVYKLIKAKKPGIMGFKKIKWNFEKFLVDREGTVAERWATTTSPASIDSTIKGYLTKKEEN
ncbi:peroxiredoxin hyr1 [Coemansia sp. RSA 1358]|uniref:Glutathione peroxidase n=1 Tax=Coemansia umbellata TaxID=1424467 RepID=A0ABQ8PSX3_9FUNG|nr:peroxiredoxin hyr1 [Coemansia umbellata]KAJ2625665.1 peroxiredoxin hyr1 [Coemansia sp. RSA 1358]